MRADISARRGAGEAKAAVEGTPSVLSAADTPLSAALESQSALGDPEYSALVASAAELLALVTAIWGVNRPGRGRRETLVDLLERRLSAHERAVLEGELTYAVSPSEAEEPAARLGKLASRLSAGGELSDSHLVALQEAALALAALQVRAAGNIATAGAASEAAEPSDPRVRGLLRRISAEVGAPAEEGLRRAPAGHDAVALHLGAGLRLLVSRRAVRGFASKPQGAAGLAAFLQGARVAWLELARTEHVVVVALDRELNVPTYEERFGSLAAVIIEGAQNVLCGSRLATRAEDFRHDKAWSSQAVGLSFVMESYIRGLRGVPDGFEQAQLIALTRLVRAVAAIALIDLHRSALMSSNGHSKPARNRAQERGEEHA
ncbi:MAG: hypothetical protein AB7V58_00180 [Solirubrobacterales bacterium]